MGTVLCVLLWLSTMMGCVNSSDMWLDNHGRFQDFVVAVHPDVSTNCSELVTNLQVRILLYLLVENDFGYLRISLTLDVIFLRELEKSPLLLLI